MPSWTWDEALAESGVVHESTAGMDHSDATVLKQGYSGANPLFSANLLASYPMHEDSGTTIVDVSGNSNDGTYNGVTLGQTGLFGTTAVSFDGDDYGTLPSIGIPTGGFSVGFVLNPDGVTAQQRLLVLRGEIQFIWEFGSTAANDAGNYRIWTGSFNDNLGSISAGAWQHFMVTHDGSTTRAYRGAVEDAAYSDSVGTDSTTSRIGTDDGNSASVHYTGDMAGLWVYDKALSASEVQTHFDVFGAAGQWTSTKQTL